VRDCFRPLLQNFSVLFSKLKEKCLNIFVLGGSPGMGKSVFGIFLILFIANAISTSYSNNEKIVKKKYSNFFPELPLKEPKKGYVILYQIKKPYQQYFIVQFSFEDSTWRCIEIGKNADLSHFSESFLGYQCFFIIDSKLFDLSEINLLYFDGIVISIGSPKFVVKINDLNKYNDSNYSYCYYPLWENSEIETFVHHFGFKDMFDPSGDEKELVMEMGLEKLKKTDVFGNNPRTLKSSNLKGVLNELIEAIKTGKLDKYINSLSFINNIQDKNIDSIIHQIFFMKPSKNFGSFSVIFASDYLFCLIGRYFDCIRINQASSLYCNSTNPLLKGTYFENYFHTYILRTMKNCVVNLKRKYILAGSEFQLENSPERECIFEVSKYNRTDEIIYSELQNNEYYCPRTFNFSTFNSVFKGTIKEGTVNKNVIFFFQCTIQDQHDIKGKNYSIIKNSLNLKDVTEISLIFLVPNTEDKFTPKKSININFDKHINVYLGSFPMLQN
jgi:hypothetical protein